MNMVFSISEEELKWHFLAKIPGIAAFWRFEAKGLCHVLADYSLLGPT